MELTDGVVVLRPPEAADVEWIVEACRDPENQRWLPLLPSPYTTADAEWWLDRAGTVWADGSAAPFLIVDVRTAERLGAIELRLAGDVSDVGYWLAPAARGRGAVTRALRLVLAWGREEHGLVRVQLYTLLDNSRSQAVARRAGFRREGIVTGKIEDRDGRHHDAYRFVRELGSERA